MSQTSQTNQSTTEKISVLIVDDNPDNRDWLNMFLTQKGYLCHEAVDGVDGIEKTNEIMPDIVLLDINMPRLDGFGVLDNLRKETTQLQLPILMLSALDETDKIVQALHNGANDYVTKPINFEVLLARIETHLRMKQIQADLNHSQERFTLAMQGSQEGLWDWDLAKDEVYLSPQWMSIIGYAYEEANEPMNYWLDRIHEQDLHGFENGIQMHREGKTELFDATYRLKHKDGSYRWVHSRGQIMTKFNGNDKRIVGSHADVTHNALTDPLTHLANTTQFLDILQQRINRVDESNYENFAIFLLDLDQSKENFQKLELDEQNGLIKALSHKLEIMIKDKAIFSGAETFKIAYFKEQEFLVLADKLPTAEYAMSLAEKFCKNLEGNYEIAQKELYLIGHVGVCTYSDEYKQAERMLTDATMAAKKAINENHECIIFDPEIEKHALENYHLELELRNALEKKEFFMVYQPIVKLADESVVGFESLIRWRHPEKGVISPVQFIPILESTQLIIPVSHWAILQVCDDIRKWKELFPGKSFRVNVNISSSYLASPHFLSDMEAIFEDHTINPQNIKCEITENILIDNFEFAEKRLKALAKMGLGLAIDDFGTGYSSLSYLHRLPFHTVKMDKVFIDKMLEAEKYKTIVDTIINLAKSLHMEVVAEGIELDSQEHALKDMGCHYGQGYLFAKPMEKTDAEGYLKRHWNP